MMEKRSIRQWLGQKSILRKLIISYVILFVLLLVSNLYIYSRTKDTLMSKEMAYNHMALDYAQEILDHSLQEIYNHSNDFMMNREMQIRLGDLHSQSNRVYMINKLMEFTQKDEFVEHAILWTPSMDSMLYDGGGISPGDPIFAFLDGENLSETIVVDQYKQSTIGYIPGSDATVDDPSSVKKGGYFVMCYSSAYASKDSKLLLLLPEDQIRDLFKDTYGSSQFFMFSRDGRFILSPERNVETDELMEQLMESVHQRGNDDFLYGDHLVLYSPSAAFSWEYGVAVDCANIYRDIALMRTVVVILLLVVFLLGGAVIILSIRQTYMPLKDILLSIGKDDRKPTENEYDKIKQELLNLKENNHIYKENLTLYELIQHGAQGNDYHEFFAEPCICSIMLAGPNLQAIRNIVPSLEAVFAEKQYHLHLVKNNSYEMYLILNGEILCYEDIVQTLKQVWTQKNPKLLAGVGAAETVQNLKQSCDKAKEAVKTGRICMGGHVYADESRNTDCIRFPLDFESRMTSLLYAADKPSVQAFVDEIFDHNQNISWSAFRKLILDFCEAYKRIASKLQITMEDDVMKRLMDFGYDIKPIRAFVQKMYCEMVFAAPVDKRANDVGTFIKDYISKNYRNSEITIEGIAEELDLAPTYVSTLFKREAQIPFSQYLSDFRIQKATDLLENTNMKIKDIAEEVGFGTYSNFARTFKKKLGVTPVEYKSQK